MALIAASALLGYLAVRPRMLRWGATKEEATEPLPGDELCPHPRVQSTRAITIEAPPEQVWPWIVQMGIERAGFYTHDWFERLLFHARYVEGKHSATRIHPELQDLKVGDPIPYGAGAYARVHALEPNRYLVHGEAWVLRPLPGGRTRLLARSRGMGYVTAGLEATGPDAPRLTRALSFLVLRVPGVKLLARTFDFFVADPLHHYMETGMLRGIQVCAEQRRLPHERKAMRVGLEALTWHLPRERALIPVDREPPPREFERVASDYRVCSNRQRSRVRRLTKKGVICDDRPGCSSE